MRNFPNWLEAYLRLTDESEAPILFNFWSGVSAIAGALRRRVWIEQLSFQWTPNFYIIFVAPPGVATKSTTMGVGASILGEIEGVKFGPQSMTWQGLSVALEEAKDIVMINETDLYPMSCITIQSSELGTFLKTKEDGLVDFLVDMWDGKKVTWRHRIKTGDKPNTEIVNPWINFIGCTTPAWMRGNFPSYMIEGGLTSRCVFLWGDIKRKLVAYPILSVNRGWYNEQRKLLVNDLQHIAGLFGEYHLDSDAQLWGVQWYQEHWTNRPAHLLSERYGGYLSRKQTHIHKLAMVLSASRSDTLEITAPILQEAERVVTAMEGDLAQVFKSIGMTNGAKNRQDVLSYIQHRQAVTQTAIYRDMLTFMDKKELDDCLAGLEKGGIIQLAVVDNKTGYVFVPPPEESNPLFERKVQ